MREIVGEMLDLRSALRRDQTCDSARSIVSFISGLDGVSRADAAVSISHGGPPRICALRQHNRFTRPAHSAPTRIVMFLTVWPVELAASLHEAGE